MDRMDRAGLARLATFSLLGLAACFNPEDDSGQDGGTADSGSEATSASTTGMTSVDTTASGTQSSTSMSTTATDTTSATSNTTATSTDTDPTATEDTGPPPMCGDDNSEAGEFCIDPAAMPEQFNVGNGAYDLALGDFDGDGYVDIATANRAAGTVSLLFNDGTGGFGNPASETVAPSPLRIRAADGDDDGDIDLVVYGSTMSTLMNDGTGDFTRFDSAVDGFGGGGEHNSMEILQGNAGSDLDVIHSGAYNSTFSGGYIGAAPQYAWLFSEMGTSIGISDEGASGLFDTEFEFDGDGFADVVAGNQYYEEVYVRLGNGNGTFSAHATVPVCQNDGAVYDGVKQIAVGDIDGNGEMDIVATCMQAAEFFVVFGNDNGTFEDGVGVPLAGAHRAIVFDVNDDGMQDILVSSISANGVAVFLNQGAGMLPDALLLPLSGPTYSVEAADFDGDGAMDIASAYEGLMGGRVAIWYAQP